jgi:hypothetical protein
MRQGHFGDYPRDRPFYLSRLDRLLI